VTVRLEITRDPRRILELREPWQSLWDRAGSDIFQRHDWIRGWLTGTAGRRDVSPLIGFGWKGDRLLAILPFEVRQRWGLRTLHWAAQQFTDYCDGMVHPDAPASILEDILGQVLRKGGFDVLHLKQVPPTGRAHRLLEAFASRPRGPRLQERHERCMRIDCRWPDGEAFFRGLNKKARNNHTRGKRILGEMGGEVVFRLHDPAMPISPVLDEIAALKTAWLRVHHPDSPLLEGDQSVLRAILDAAWSSGLMQVFLLESGGRMAAASINFAHQCRMQAYITAYDPEFERASPGTILIVEYAKWAFDRGFRQVDFLRGEEPFKFRMANAHTLLDEYLGARTLLGQAAVAARNWRSSLRPADVTSDPTAAKPEEPEAAELQVPPQG
jgi:CelD/BcsL family acetyltransferase involved in cellulose biosynthesis